MLGLTHAAFEESAVTRLFQLITFYSFVVSLYDKLSTCILLDVPVQYSM